MNKESKLSLRGGIRYASRDPRQAARVLSKMLEHETKSFSKLSIRLRLTLVTHLLSFLSIPREKVNIQNGRELLKKISKLPLSQAIRLALRYPKEGMRFLASIVYEELIFNQQFNNEELMNFINIFLDHILKEIKSLPHLEPSDSHKASS